MSALPNTTTTTEGPTLLLTRRLKIRLWLFTAQAFLLTFVLGVLGTLPTAAQTWQSIAAIYVTAGILCVLLGLVVGGWLGYASMVRTEKESRRGEPHNHRP